MTGSTDQMYNEGMRMKNRGSNRYREDNSFRERSLNISDVSDLVLLFREVFSEISELYNFNPDYEEAIVDWAITELYSNGLRAHNKRVIGHSFYDEGLLLLDHVDHRVRDRFEKYVYRRYANIQSDTVKIMICGNSAILAY